MNNLVASHRYDEARELAEQSEFQDYGTASARVFLRLSEHGDIGRWAQDEADIQKEFGDDADPSGLWVPLVANRKYLAAEELLGDLQETGDISRGMGHFASRLPSEIFLYWMLQRDDQLATKLQELRLLLEQAKESASENDERDFDLVFALIAAAEGNTEETVRLINRWRRGDGADWTERVNRLNLACEFLGMAGATKAAVECLRNALVEPSYVMPFLEPYLPFYDPIKDEPDFVELLAELEEARTATQ